MPDSELKEYIFKRPGKDDNIQGGASTVRTSADIEDGRVDQQERVIKEFQIKLSNLREDTRYQRDRKTTQTSDLVFPTQETYPISPSMKISSAPSTFSTTVATATNVTHHSSQVVTSLVSVTTTPTVVTKYLLVNSTTAVVTSDSAINLSASSPNESSDIKCKFRKSDGLQCNAPTQER